MATRDEWELPEALRPQQSHFDFDLQTIYRSAVLVHAEASEDGYTASDLGISRIGSGVVIRSAERKLVLTIGYLITEAESIWLTTHDGKVVEAFPLAFDQVSGFGLIQPLGPLDAPPLERGSAASLAIGDKIIVVGHGGERHSLEAQLIARREFAGYWEYLLDEAQFHPTADAEARTACCWASARCSCRSRWRTKASTPICLFRSTCSSRSSKT